MGTVANVLVGANGVAYVAPTGSTAPTDSTTAVAAAFKNLGFVSEDGLTEGVNISTSEIKAWDGSTIRKVISGSEKTFKVKCLEAGNGNVIDLFYTKPTITVATGKSTVAVKTPVRDLRAFIIDVVDGSAHRRFYIPSGEVTDRSDVPYKNSEGIAYEFTITAYPDSSGNLFTMFADSDLTPA